jgi:hypothetical protein
MKNDKLIPGIILVTIGAAILLSNYGYLEFHWENIFRLWPIFLVIAGVNLVLGHYKSPWSTIIKTAVVVLGLGLMLFGNFGNRYNFWPGWRYHYHHNDNNDSDDNKDMDDDDDNDNDSGKAKMAINGAFNEPYKSNVKIARLNISGGAISYNLSDTTNQLFNAVTKDNINKYVFSQSMDDSVYVLNFKNKDHHGFNFDSDKNRADFRLNPNPEWEINVQTGASSLDFDLSKFKVRSLKLSGGAASFDVKLGMPLKLTDVYVSTGVSGVDISIPQTAACSIETDSGLSGNDFEGIPKISDNTYETPGYATAKNKMHIHISGGLSGFNVTRY